MTIVVKCSGHELGTGVEFTYETMVGISVTSSMCLLRIPGTSTKEVEY
jgi:hypothetical protein